MLAAFFPLDETGFQTLTEEQIEHIDQFIYRFMRLQDSMGRRLFPALITMLDNDPAPRPFLDVLARLEQLGIIPNDVDWQFFCNLRNNLAHDYPENITITIETLNVIYAEWDRMEHMYRSARGYYQTRYAGL